MFGWTDSCSLLNDPWSALASFFNPHKMATPYDCAALRVINPCEVFISISV
jgi:hypothetical protein